MFSGRGRFDAEQSGSDDIDCLGGRLIERQSLSATRAHRRRMLAHGCFRFPDPGTETLGWLMLAHGVRAAIKDCHVFKCARHCRFRA
ncbi:protein of unknown function [Hyphomicrobium sp. 1Nfss2.1]